MKNKLINIKNFLRIVISLMVIFAYAKSCAKALTYEDLKEYVNYTADYYSTNTYYQIIKARINGATQNAINDINTAGSGYQNVSIYNPQNSIVTIKFWNSTFLEGNLGGLWYTGNYKTIQWNNAWGSIVGPTNQTNSSIDGGYSFSYTINYENNLRGMTLLNQTLTTGQFPNTFVGSQGIPQWIYLEYVNSIEDSTHNGSLFTYYFQGDLYSQNDIKLGQIIINDSYYYEVRLKNSNSDVVLGTIFYDVNSDTTYNDGAIYQDSSKNIYVTTRLLNYSTQYQLEIESYYGDGGSNLYEDIDWYIFLPTNAIISGDSIQDFGSGEFTTQDSTNQIISNLDNLNNTIESGNQELINNINNSSEVDNIIGEYTSGDIETISSDLGFSALDNPFTSFLFFVIEGVYDVLTEREDIVLSTHYKSLEFNLASTDFTIPQNELKTFIRNMLVCVYIYGNYKWFHYMITLLETARINKFMAEIGTDEFYDTDIM